MEKKKKAEYTQQYPRPKKEKTYLKRFMEFQVREENDNVILTSVMQSELSFTMTKEEILSKIVVLIGDSINIKKRKSE